jgi:hypothetical protein
MDGRGIHVTALKTLNEVTRIGGVGQHATWRDHGLKDWHFGQERKAREDPVRGCLRSVRCPLTHQEVVTPGLCDDRWRYLTQNLRCPR